MPHPLVPVRFDRRHFGLLLGGTAAGLAGLSACGNDKSALTGSQTDVDAYDAVILAAPVADAATVSGNAWAAKIKARGTLITGGSDSGPLFSIRDPSTGKLTGFDAGLAQMLSRYITGGSDVNKLLDLKITTVDTRETLIQNGTVDAVFATYSITTARAQKVAFAGPYYRSGNSVMVKTANTEVKSITDLAGKTVATQQGSTAPDKIKKAVPTAKISLFPDNAQCLAALKTDRVDAYVIDQSILISDASADKSLKVVGEPFDDDYYGIGVTRDDASAKAFVNAWLKTIEDNGSWAKLWSTTIGTVVEGEAPKPPEIGSVEGS